MVFTLNKFLAQKNIGLPKTFIASTDKLKKSRDEIIDLSLGDPNISTADFVIKKAARDVAKKHSGYAHPRGDVELRKKITDYYQNNYGVTINKKEIMITVGACHATFLALNAVLDPGDEVIIPSPYFTPYKRQVELAGGKPVFINLFEKEKFQINPDRLENKINKNTKVILINSPHNPTGIIQKPEIIETISALALKYDLLLISDEVYGSFSYNNNFTSFLAQEKLKDNLIIVNSFSKIFAMTGWRVGFASGPKKLLDIMQEINEGVCFSAPSISQRAALKALQHTTEITKNIKG